MEGAQVCFFLSALFYNMFLRMSKERRSWVWRKERGKLRNPSKKTKKFEKNKKNKKQNRFLGGEKNWDIIATLQQVLDCLFGFLGFFRNPHFKSKKREKRKGVGRNLDSDPVFFLQYCSIFRMGFFFFFCFYLSKSLSSMVEGRDCSSISSAPNP